MTSTPDVSSSQDVYAQLHAAIHAYRNGNPVPPLTGPEFAVTFIVSYQPTQNRLTGAADVALNIVPEEASASIQAMYMAIGSAQPPAAGQQYCEAIIGPSIGTSGPVNSPPIALPRRLTAFSTECEPFTTNTTVWGVAILTYTTNGKSQTGLVSIPVTVSNEASAIQQTVIMNAAQSS